MLPPFRLHTERTFRETAAVHFADLNIPGTNGLDLVTHYGPAVSPPNDELLGMQWYMHRHQTDHNRVLSGARLFELVHYDWTNSNHWYVYLTPDLGALEIPPGCYHRSYSCLGGSILINQAMRDEYYDEGAEFNPTRPNYDLIHSVAYFNCTPKEAENFILYGGLNDIK